MRNSTLSISAKQIPVSVCVVVRNEAERVASCLRSLAKSGASEIIVIDNNSNDGTPTLVNSLRDSQGKLDGVELRLVMSGENHMGKSRQTAVWISRNPWVAFTDADCRTPPNWAVLLFHQAQALDGKDDTNLLAVGGGNLPPENAATFYRTHRICTQHWLGHLNSTQAWRPGQIRSVHHLPTCNILYHRERLLSVGGFSSSFDVVCEDLELSTRARQAGMSLVFLPGADVEHDFGASFVTWGLRLFRYGEGQIKVMAHHPRFARSLKIIPLIFGWTMLGLLAEYAVSGDHRFLLPALLYVLTITSVSGHLAARERKLGATPALLTWFLVTHFSYSAGEVWGSIRWIVLNMSKWGPNSYRSVWPSTLKS